MGFRRSADKRLMEFLKSAKYLSFLLIWGAVAAFGAENLPGNVPGPNYTSARGAAMGDAFLPLADDDASALFYNPASLTKIRSTGFAPLDLSFYGNSGYLGNLSSSNLTKIPSLSAYQPTLQQNLGAFSGGGFQLFPSFFTRGLAFGILLKSDVGAVANPDGTLTYKSLYQLIPTIGGGIRLAEGIVKIGYSLQWVNEAAGSNTVNPSALSNCSTLGYNQCLAQGSAFSSTVGTTITMPWEYLPALSVVARNVGGEHFGTSSLYHFSPSPTGAPPYQPMSIDAAFSIQPKLGGGASYMNLVGEVNDLSNTAGMSILGRWAAGAELSIHNLIFFRTGWGQGYPSAGFGVRQRHGEIDFSWYSQELSDSYHGMRDERYMFQYVVRAF